MNQSNQNNIVIGSLLSFISLIVIMYADILRSFPTAIYTQLISDFSLTREGLARISSISFFAYLSGVIITSIIVEIINPKYALIGAAIILSIGSYLFGHADNLTSFLLSKIFISFGSGFVLIGALKLASTWLPKKIFPIFVGVAISIGFFVSPFSMSLLAYLLEISSRNAISYQIGNIGIMLLILLLATRKYSNNQKILYSKLRIVEVKNLFRNVHIWVACFISFITASYTLFFSLFGTPFLMQNGYSQLQAASISLWFIWGIGCGTIIAGILGSIYNRKYILMLGLIAATAAMIFILYSGSHISGYYVISRALFLFGLFSGVSIILYVIANDINSVVGIAFGLISLSGMIGGIFIQPIMGELYQLTHHWSIVLAIIPITLFLGSMASLFLRINKSR